MELTFEPYIGAGPFNFDATPNEVQLNFKDEPNTSKDYLGNRREDYGSLGFCYDENDRLSEICFPSKGIFLFLDTQCLLGETKAQTLDLLLKKDPNPLEVSGFLVFLKIGVNITGYHDKNKTQKSFNIFRKGWWDDMLDDSKPFKQDRTT